MATQDKCCTIVPYFKVQSGKLENFKELCEQFVEKTSKEPKCLYYGLKSTLQQAAGNLPGKDSYLFDSLANPVASYGECARYCRFSFAADRVHCREGYEDADGVLAHLENVGTLQQEALKIAGLTHLEIHGPQEELAKLRAPLDELKPQLFTLEYGFRR